MVCFLVCFAVDESAIDVDGDGELDTRTKDDKLDIEAEKTINRITSISQCGT